MTNWIICTTKLPTTVTTVTTFAAKEISMIKAVITVTKAMVRSIMMVTLVTEKPPTRAVKTVTVVTPVAVKATTRAVKTVTVVTPVAVKATTRALKTPRVVTQVLDEYKTF